MAGFSDSDSEGAYLMCSLSDSSYDCCSRRCDSCYSDSGIRRYPQTYIERRTPSIISHGCCCECSLQSYDRCVDIPCCCSGVGYTTPVSTRHLLVGDECNYCLHRCVTSEESRRSHSTGSRGPASEKSSNRRRDDNQRKPESEQRMRSNSLNGNKSQLARPPTPVKAQHKMSNTPRTPIRTLQRPAQATRDNRQSQRPYRFCGMLLKPYRCHHGFDNVTVAMPEGCINTEMIAKRIIPYTPVRESKVLPRSPTLKIAIRWPNGGKCREDKAGQTKICEQRKRIFHRGSVHAAHFALRPPSKLIKSKDTQGK